MSTPRTKLSLQRTNIVSKYLTPCRTLGLKRKSTSPRTPEFGSKVICRTEESDSPVSSREPLQLNENKNSVNISDENVIIKEVAVRKQNPSIKNISIENSCIDVNTRKKKPDKETEEVEGLISNEMLLETAKSINSKLEKIKNLKRNEVYTRKHDINELRRSSEKWKTACKEVVLAIYEALKSKGHNTSISNILEQHNIPYDCIGFNEETMDFD